MKKILSFTIPKTHPHWLRACDIPLHFFTGSETQDLSVKEQVILGSKPWLAIDMAFRATDGTPIIFEIQSLLSSNFPNKFMVDRLQHFFKNPDSCIVYICDYKTGVRATQSIFEAQGISDINTRYRSAKRTFSPVEKIVIGDDDYLKKLQAILSKKSGEIWVWVGDIAENSDAHRELWATLQQNLSLPHVYIDCFESAPNSVLLSFKATQRALFPEHFNPDLVITRSGLDIGTTPLPENPIVLLKETNGSRGDQIHIWDRDLWETLRKKPSVEFLLESCVRTQSTTDAQQHYRLYLAPTSEGHTIFRAVEITAPDRSDESLSLKERYVGHGNVKKRELSETDIAERFSRELVSEFSGIVDRVTQFDFRSTLLSWLESSHPLHVLRGLDILHVGSTHYASHEELFNTQLWGSGPSLKSDYWQALSSILEKIWDPDSLKLINQKLTSLFLKELSHILNTRELTSDTLNLILKTQKHIKNNIAGEKTTKQLRGLASDYLNLRALFRFADDTMREHANIFLKKFKDILDGFVTTSTSEPPTGKTSQTTSND